jgi:hypothetical protein
MKRLFPPSLRVVGYLFAAGLLWPLSASALEADARLKWFTTAGFLPEHDVQRQRLGTPSTDSTVDVRLMFKQDVGAVRLILDHSTVLISGDAVELQLGPDSSLDQTVVNDAMRAVDMTWEIENGNRHTSFHRIDRLALQWQKGDWGVTLGRQAVSWGSGIVFQPMDPFNPFSPTVVDRDYKAGDDLLLIDRLFEDGSDLQLLHVVRRDEFDHIGSDVSSTAAKWHGYAGEVELEIIAAQHFDEPWAGVTFRFPIGQALLRTDIVGSRLEAGGWQVSGLVNLDYSFNVADHNAYLFAEYFHNDVGVDELPSNPALLPVELLRRLGRGEVFNVMRDYSAVGGNFEWHPLVSQSATLITNLHDASSLFQTNISYTPSDNTTMQFGWIEPLGGTGDEYGDIEVFVAPNGEQITTGGASRIYLRWVYYF